MPFWNSILKKLRLEDDNHHNKRVIEINNAANVIKELDGVTDTKQLTSALNSLTLWNDGRLNFINSLSDKAQWEKLHDSVNYTSLFNMAKWAMVGVGFAGIGTMFNYAYHLRNDFDADKDSYLTFGVKNLLLIIATWEMAVHCYKTKRHFAQKEGISSIEENEILKNYRNGFG